MKNNYIKEILEKKPYYVKMNYSDTVWKDFKLMLDDDVYKDDYKYVEIKTPIYFFNINKQYVYKKDISDKMKKMFIEKLETLLEVADNLVDIINEIDINSSNSDDELQLKKRKIKIRELLVKSGIVKI